jgi:hypothetical protein
VQRSKTIHSITSSARTRKHSGTVSPSAFAVVTVGDMPLDLTPNVNRYIEAFSEKVGGPTGADHTGTNDADPAR